MTKLKILLIFKKRARINKIIKIIDKLIIDYHEIIFYSSFLIWSFHNNNSFISIHRCPNNLRRNFLIEQSKIVDSKNPHIMVYFIKISINRLISFIFDWLTRVFMRISLILTISTFSSAKATANKAANRTRTVAFIIFEISGILKKE